MLAGVDGAHAIREHPALSELEAMLADGPTCTLLCTDGSVPAHAEVLSLASSVLREALRLDKTVKVLPHDL